MSDMSVTFEERQWTPLGRPKLRNHKGELGPSGPWTDEPDKVQWVDKATGLDALAVRNRHGAWCGYVGVPPEHPWHGKSYDQGPEDMIEVHGGLTFSASCREGLPEGEGVCHVPYPGRPANVWWFGFDCNHAWDYAPVMYGADWDDPDVVYRDLAYVRGEVAYLAAQLAKVTS